MNYYAHKFFTTLCFGRDIDLIESCILPDEDEAQNGFSCHFYNPVTEKCFLGTEDSAKNRFLWHLSNYCLKGKKEELGRAIHFLEDICTPVHTQYQDAVDAAIRLKFHIDFEKKLDSFLENSSGYDDWKTLRFYSVFEILLGCSCNSSELYFEARNNHDENMIFSSVKALTISALQALKRLVNSNKIIAKTFTVDGEKINVIFEKEKMLPSCLNTNYRLKYNGIDNVAVYKRKNKISNYNFIGKIF